MMKTRTETIPNFPLICLQTADDTSTVEVVKNKSTVIDFWTTKCTRCPDALDKLNKFAQDPKFSKVQFLSICCDKLDGAREIIEKEDELRWKYVKHYFMEHQDKEKAKEVLAFQSVPFILVVNDKGEICQKGGANQIDYDIIPGVIQPDKENDASHADRNVINAPVERVFVLEDLDF